MASSIRELHNHVLACAYKRAELNEQLRQVQAEYEQTEAAFQAALTEIEQDRIARTEPGHDEETNRVSSAYSHKKS